MAKREETTESGIAGADHLANKTVLLLPIKTASTRAHFLWQFLSDNVYLPVYMRKFAQILCDKFIF